MTFGPKWLMNQNDLDKKHGPKWLLDQNNFWTKATFGPKQLLNQNNFWTKTTFGPKQLLDQNYFWTKTPFGPKQLLNQNKTEEGRTMNLWFLVWIIVQASEHLNRSILLVQTLDCIKKEINALETNKTGSCVIKCKHFWIIFLSDLLSLLTTFVFYKYCINMILFISTGGTIDKLYPRTVRWSY